MWLKGGAGKLKFVSARFPTEPSRGVQFVTLSLWIGKNHSEGIDTFDMRSFRKSFVRRIFAYKGSFDFDWIIHRQFDG